MNPVHLPSSSQAERAVLALTLEVAWEATWGVIQQAQNLLGAAACELLRHSIGNPFRPYLAPDHWPTAVFQLASASSDGQDCGFALHDALLSRPS